MVGTITAFVPVIAVVILTGYEFLIGNGENAVRTLHTGARFLQRQHFVMIWLPIIPTILACEFGVRLKQGRVWREKLPKRIRLFWYIGVAVASVIFMVIFQEHAPGSHPMGTNVQSSP